MFTGGKNGEGVVEISSSNYFEVWVQSILQYSAQYSLQYSVQNSVQCTV